MKSLIVLCALLAGCADFTPKQWAYITAGVLITGALTAQELNNGNHHRCDNCGTLVQVPYP